ncbi:hypothetical protein [Aureimonas populi]|uniref:Uncharacterized protein n=1 Tax=Aureimonas populi TaxID=1701758 RepID=A0ABW5CQ53_9HYPH|nr:hypothetical protein [Aureimonas populi]
MSVDAEIREAIIQEIQRQAEASEGKLTARMDGDRLAVHGAIDVDDLVMVVMGSIAGGP